MTELSKERVSLQISETLPKIKIESIETERDDKFINYMMECGISDPIQMHCALMGKGWADRNPVQTWTPVSERMPETNKAVIVLYSYDHEDKKVVKADTALWHETGKWFFTHPIEGEVTHWMEIPTNL